MTNHYIKKNSELLCKKNSELLCNYPAIKTFIILSLDLLQELLIVILLNIISNTL